MRYEHLPHISKEEAVTILSNNDYNKIKVLPLSLGEYCDDIAFAQEVCLKLLNNSNEEVVSNAILGLSYIARNFRYLNKFDVEAPVLATLRKKYNIDTLSTINLAIDDIYLFSRWNYSFAYVKSKFIYYIRLIEDRVHFKRQ